MEPHPADIVVVERIVKDAKAAGVKPKDVTGELAAGTDVCVGCQGRVAAELPGVKVTNPAPSGGGTSTSGGAKESGN